MSSRFPVTSSFGGDGNLSRRDTRSVERDPPNAGISKATTISFTSPDKINDSANSFTWLGGANGTGWCEVRGSAGNSRVYNITAGNSGQVTVVPPLVVTEAAGPLITVFNNC